MDVQRNMAVVLGERDVKFDVKAKSRCLKIVGSIYHYYVEGKNALLPRLQMEIMLMLTWHR